VLWVKLVNAETFTDVSNKTERLELLQNRVKNGLHHCNETLSDAL